MVADLNLDGAKTVAAEIGGQPWGVDLANPDWTLTPLLAPRVPRAA